MFKNYYQKNLYVKYQYLIAKKSLKETKRKKKIDDDKQKEDLKNLKDQVVIMKLEADKKY